MAELPIYEKHRLPGGVLFAAALSLLLVISLSILMGYGLLTYVPSVGFIRSIMDTAAVKLAILVQPVLEALLVGATFDVNIVKAILTVVSAYPLPFLSLAALSMLVSVVLVKQVSLFQRKNYA
jgi:hypothetical protein